MARQFFLGPLLKSLPITVLRYLYLSPLPFWRTGGYCVSEENVQWKQRYPSHLFWNRRSWHARRSMCL